MEEKESNEENQKKKENYFNKLKEYGKDFAYHLWNCPDYLREFVVFLFQGGVNDPYSWIVPILYGSNKKEQLLKLFEKNSGVCGAQWSYGEISFKCKTCQTDPTCAICAKCFQNGDHEGHEYSMSRNSSGICDW